MWTQGLLLNFTAVSSLTPHEIAELWVWQTNFCDSEKLDHVLGTVTGKNTLKNRPTGIREIPKTAFVRFDA